MPHYAQRNINKNLGVLCNDDDENVIIYVVVIPIKSANSRTGFLAQQLMPTLTNLMHEQRLSVGNILTNKPILIINSNTETYTQSNALNILASIQIPSVYYTDLFARNPYDKLNSREVEVSISTLNSFVDAVNIISTRSDAKFEYDSSQQLLTLKQGNLMNPGNSMTNQPYYYLMTVIPAICMASKEKIKIDDSELKEWWENYSSQTTNKNIQYFIEWISKLNQNGGKTLQKIFFGSPGTGKSHSIKEYLSNIVVDERKQVFRTTFHPEYSYSDFVGQIMPERIYDSETGKYDISYEFYEGVFTKALKQAYLDHRQNVYLVIEEMSRGNVAAIFGDLFQLLDRYSDGVQKGWSKYSIRNGRIAEKIPEITSDEILLPPNLHIFGTVNTSDQNVFTMDTAFKRRFQWEYIDTLPVENTSNTTSSDLSDKYYNNPKINLNLNSIQLEEVFWTDLYGTLNIFITDNRYLGMGEDKKIGPFFIDFSGKDNIEIKEEILNKLLSYLWTDIANNRNNRNTPLFNQAVVTSFSTLYASFKNDQKIFSNEFIEAYNKWKVGSL